MRIVVMTSGSRGDVQPYIALGLGLQRAGYQVCMLTHSIFAPMIEQYGLEFAALSGDPRAIVESEEGLRLLETGGNAVRFVRRLFAESKKNQVAMTRAAERVLPGAHLLLYSVLCFAGSYVAEALNIPAMLVPLQPILPTRAFPYPTGFSRSLGSVGNLLTHRLVNMGIWQLMRSTMQPIRHELGLPPIPVWGSISWLYKQHQPVLLGYSPLILPRPADWPDWVHVTGYWFLDAPSTWQPPADLLDFLAAGPPPVYIGFGSMASRKAEETTNIILNALARSDQRGIIATGWGGLSNSDLPDNVFKLEEAPHDWLFPRMAAVVHHGGSGTTAAGLRAGVPNIVVPFFADQPFWGERVYRLGVAAKPIPRQHLTAENLAAAITTTISDQAMSARAADLGARIRAEDGVGNATHIIRNLISSELASDLPRH
ncbi:glycosyltransferase [Dictyobacter formicarum]|uniref:Glycosyltransferase family 28 N-terminal domain-containing protein n=1 Tax=Dictyobacter formicarum TaxID=2778368 RepID=A0ABQ3VTF0_9CHLR|nr:glycosyltransferase [Dictyobacter formicarum]GHO88396.1 hypothetical protein KSZ_64020 [Dictyobacter formicarum]